MVSCSGLVEDPSVCGVAVCVQLIGARTMGGCWGQKKQSLYVMTEMYQVEKSTCNDKRYRRK